MSKFKPGDFVRVVEQVVDTDYPVGTVAKVTGVDGFGDVWLIGDEHYYSADQLEMIPEKLATSKLWKVLK